MDKQLIERCAIAAMRETAEGVEAGEVMDREIELAAIDHMDEESKSLTVKLFSAFLARIDAERGKEAVAWFALADNNGPVPLELWGFDEKACKHAVLENARSVGWKGTIEGYLLHMGWTIRPLFLSPTIPEGMAKDAERYRFIRMNRLWLKANLPLIAAPAFDEAIDAGLLAATQGERNAD